MARRGRFGRSETGASNLSATIASLVRQQKQEEEKALLEAYYSEIPYAGGSVPTLQDVIDFYKDSARMAGINEGTQEYQAMFQKINDITNYDIKREYGNLIEEFNASDGANYDQLLEFIGTRAQTSTSQDDLEEYAQAVETTTTAFLRYKGESLKRGEITPKEYQAITMNALQALGPGTQEYESAIYDAFSYEWAAQSEIWGNRLKAGLISQSQFASLAKSLADRMLASGVAKGSALYTGVLASIASASGGVGSSQANKRIGNNTSKLASAYLIAAAATGIGDRADLIDLQENPDKVLDYISKNPSVFLAYNDYLAANPGAENLLIAEGIDISSAEEFEGWVNRKLDRIQSDYAISGNEDKYLEATRAKRASGLGSVEDDFSYASNKRNNLLADAKNPIDEAYIRNQWREYINGSNSKLFGQIPGGSAEAFAKELFRSSPYLVGLYQNEVDAVNGDTVESGIVTLSGRYDNNTGNLNIDNDWVNAKPTEDQSYALATGLGVWDPTANNGLGEVMAPVNAGFDKGVYQQVTFGQGANGSLIPFVTAYSGEPLFRNGATDGDVVGYVYEVNGETLALNTDGRKISAPVAKEFNKWVVKDTAASNTTVSVIDTSVASTPALLRQAVTSLQNGLLQTGTLPDEVVNKINDGITAATTAANLRQAAQLQTLPNLSPQQRKQIYELRGSNVSEWDKFVSPNLSKYTESSPGIWVLKPEFAKREEEKGPFSLFDLGPGVGAGISFRMNEQLPQIVDIRTEKDKQDYPSAAEEAKGLVLDPGTGLVFSDSDKKTEDKNVFFRNMNQFRAGERESLNINIPKPSAKPIIPEAPKVQVFTPKQINQSFVDFRAGERESLNIKTDFTEQEIEQSLIDFRAGERNI